MSRLGATAVVGCALLLGGCAGALAPKGEGARRIADLWWLMFWLGIFAFVVVMALLVVVWMRRGAEGSDGEGHRWVVGGAAFSAALLVPVAVVTVTTAFGLSSDEPEAVQVTVVGHQYWWDVFYETADGTPVRTANELHVPVGRAVDLVLESADVIHSFWIPELHGKMDLVPGRSNELQLRAEEPGVFIGQCAEFCGLAHAQMRLVVVAHPEEEFQAWWEQEQAPAEVEVEVGVLQNFANSCAPCHTVRGLFEDPMYEGDFGPDLTGIASRRMLAANIMPNTVEGLARWIIDPAGVKPGTKMPAIDLEGEELDGIIDLLQQLD